MVGESTRVERNPTLNLVARLKALFGSPPPEVERMPLPVVERCPARRRTLRCALPRTLGPASIRIFPAGAVEEFQFFQRFGISPDHDVEFMTRLDADDANTENFRAYGVFGLRGAWKRLPD